MIILILVKIIIIIVIIIIIITIIPSAPTKGGSLGIDAGRQAEHLPRAAVADDNSVAVW